MNARPASSSPRTALDVSGLPTYAFGNRSLMWWGTWGLVLIESTVFAIAIVAYFYLRGLAGPQWPPSGPPPGLLFGTLNLALLLVSGIPNQWAKHVAEREELGKVRIGLVIATVFGLAILAVRGFEFTALNTHWRDHAYGSIVYALMLLHTTHLITDVIDTIVLGVLMFTGPLDGSRFVDVSENAMYWWFVVLGWIPVYLTIYIAPRVG
jgi:heme/copper-type cytochrome/quinol oxidase subunit 3